MRRAKFTGIPFTPMEKCKHCERFAECSTMENDKMVETKCILIGCAGFYYVFRQLKVLHKRPLYNGDPEKHRAELLAYEKEHEGVPDLMSPLVVNGAFAAELALKFLIFKEDGEFDCIHNLRTLFEHLPDCHKVSLTEALYQQAHQNAEKLGFNLKNISNLFVDFRYAFSKDRIGYTNFFSEFVHILCDYVLALAPLDDEDFALSLIGRS